MYATNRSLLIHIFKCPVILRKRCHDMSCICICKVILNLKRKEMSMNLDQVDYV